MARLAVEQKGEELGARSPAESALNLTLSTTNPPSVPGAHLAQVVEVVLVSNPPVTGLGTVRLVGDVSGVLALTHEELAFEELDTHREPE